MARSRVFRSRRSRRGVFYRRRNNPVLSRNVTFWSACFDIQAGAQGHAMLANAFSIPPNCSVKIYGVVVWIGTDKGCTLGVLRVQVGGGGDRSDAASARLMCITSGVARRLWLRMPSYTDFHIYPPNSAVNLAHGTDCGGGSGKFQVSVTLYWLWQPDLLG